jgi:hypothetical protein
MKQNESKGSDSLISRELEQEVLDVLDDKVPADFYTQGCNRPRKAGRC